MKRALGFAILLASTLAWGRPHDLPVPQVLIVQLHNPVIDSGSPQTPPIDPNLRVADILAQSLDDDGRVEPIVWSMTDPIFRQAVMKGQLRVGEGDPTLAEAQAAASKMGWEYVMFVKAFKSGGEVLGQARLYRGRGENWRDPQAVDREQLAGLKRMLREKRMTQAEFDKAVQGQEYLHLQVIAPTQTDTAIAQAEENTAKSIARTWSESLLAAPFKAYPPKRKTQTPNPAQGQNPQPNGPQVQLPTAPVSHQPTNPNLPVDPKLPPDNKALKASLKSLLDSHQESAAVALLRDAIDVSPLDYERRTLLINLLAQTGNAELAAQTARRAAAIMPEKPGFHLLAAKAWLQAGKPDEAQTDLNEAVARDPDSADTRLLLGQIALAKGDLPNALDHLGAGIKKNPSSDLYFERAIGDVIAGDEKAAAADLAKATEIGLAPETAGDRYREAARQLDLAVQRDSKGTTALIQKVAVNRKDPSERVQLEKSAHLAAARANFLDKLVPPTANRKSHDQRILALKLLVQCLGDVRTYLESGDADSLSDARLNLGEALNGFAAAKALFESESASPTAHANL